MEEAGDISKSLSAWVGARLHLLEAAQGGSSADAIYAPIAELWRLATKTIAAKCVLPALDGRTSKWVPILCDDDLDRLSSICSVARACHSPLPRAITPERFFEEAVNMQMRKFCLPLKNLLVERFSPNNLHSNFLASLFGANDKVSGGDERDAIALASALNQWNGNAMPRQCPNPVLGFRIVDPIGYGVGIPHWRIVPVAIVGEKARSISRKLLNEIGSTAAQHLLFTLGQASKFFNGLTDENDGSDNRFVAASLDGASLRTFMESAAPRLAAARFPVFAPRWWKPIANRRPAIRAISVERIRKEGAFSLDSIVNVKWEVVLDGTGISPQQLKWMAENDVAVARVGRSWMNVDPALVKKAAATLASLSGRTMSLRDLIRLGIGVHGDIDISVGNNVIPKEAHRLSAPLMSSGKIKPIAIPESFAGTLRPYQKTGLDWLSFLRKSGFGACLADDMGLGKTVETLVALLDARREGSTAPFLVVCPMSIMLKWLHETRKFAPSLSVWIFHGPNRPQGNEFLYYARKHDICITSYSTLATEVDLLSKVWWEAVILDEAQNIKNPDTLKSRAARSLEASWRLAITGTPIENGITDIWAIMDFANRGLLPGRTDFERIFCNSRPDIADATALSAAKRLRKIVAPFVLRRTKSDPAIAAGLPDKIEEKVYCHLTAEQASIYAAETSAAEKDIANKSGISRRGAVLALITRLKQICDYPTGDTADELYYGDSHFPLNAPKTRANLANDPLDSSRSGKLATLDEMLAQIISAGEASLVFTQYASFGKLLARHISANFGFDVPFLHGGVPANARAELVKTFQDPAGPPVFIVSIRAGGLGFDMTRATHVFHYDRWWNPATESQATDRAHRIGQEKTVFVHTFICDGTLESKIDDLITGKRQLAGRVVTDGTAFLANLDDKLLKEVIELSHDASGI